MDFTSLPPSIVDDLYEEPTKLEVLTLDDLLNLPLNDLYLKENGNDPASFAKYKPKVVIEEKPEDPEITPTQKDTSICLYCSSANAKSCKYCSYKRIEAPVFTPEELERLVNKKS